MTPRLVALADTPPQPWRNGGGMTRELLAAPAGDRWRVRVSVADIAADGPFSTFAGVQRWFAVLEGDGVALTMDGTEQLRRAGDPPLQFSEAAAVTCRLLHGPSRDLNLMLRGSPGAMRAVEDGARWTPGMSQCGLYSLVEGRCLAGTEEIDVPAASLLWFAPAPDALTFHAERAPHPHASAWWLAADTAEPDA